MNTGYRDAVTLAADTLATLSPKTVCRRCGVHWAEGAYHIPWFNRLCPLSEAKPPHLIIWLHYLISEGTREPTGRLISYRETPGALFYNRNFMGRATRPLARCFGADPQALVRTGLRLGGAVAQGGDAAVTVPALPKFPMTFMVWAGDDEMAPSGNILFDQTAIGWFGAEDLAVIASLGAYEMIAAYRQTTDGVG